MPTISVIVPVYKVEKHLHRCVDSILGQTFRDFALILVDDGSPDECPSICDEYAKQDPRVIVIHQRNGGLSAARNTGIDWVFANSDSEWLTFIDSDDWVHPEFLTQLFSAVMDEKVSVAVCGYMETSGAQPEVYNITERQRLSAEELFEEHFVNATIACGKLYHRSCFASIRYPVGKIHEDEFVTYRILFKQGEVAFLPSPLYAYYINPQGITKNAWSPKRLDALDAMEEQISFYQSRQLWALQERVIRNYARMLMRQYEEFKRTGYIDKETVKRFMHKASWFLSNFTSYYQNDTETKINLFWIAHPILSRIYHGIIN